MTALQFPVDPSGGDTYEGYIYNANKNVWQWVTTSIDAVNPQYGDIFAYDPAGTKFTNTLDVNGVMVFDDDDARATAIPTPAQGMVTYLKDTNQVQAFDGSAFTPVGTIINVFSEQMTTTQSFSSTQDNFQDLTGLSITLTPVSANSKFWILANFYGALNLGTVEEFIMGRVMRDSTQIILTTQNSFGSADSSQITNTPMFVLDSPSTTSPITYKVQGTQSASGSALTVLVNRTNNANVVVANSFITVMEVAG